jgi:hypothetical protein
MEGELARALSSMLIDYETLALAFNSLYTILKKNGLVCTEEMQSTRKRLISEAKSNSTTN